MGDASQEDASPIRETPAPYDDRAGIDLFSRVDDHAGHPPDGCWARFSRGAHSGILDRPHRVFYDLAGFLIGLEVERPSDLDTVLLHMKDTHLASRGERELYSRTDRPGGRLRTIDREQDLLQHLLHLPG